jgi:hypothetical protein
MLAPVIAKFSFPAPSPQIMDSSPVSQGLFMGGLQTVERPRCFSIRWVWNFVFLCEVAPLRPIGKLLMAAWLR